MNRSRALALVVTAATLVSCGGGERSGPRPPDNPPVSIDPATTGSISGRAIYAGPELPQVMLDLSGDPRCEKERSGSVYTPELVVGPDQALANAVVWVKEGAPRGTYPVPRERAVLTQRGCSYTPRVQALIVGSSLEIRNDDATMHNVHVLAQANRGWNRSQIEGGIPIVETFTKEEMPVTFKCNVHPWMKAQLAVLATPFFAVTSPDGRFEISGLPPGQYTLAVWHETLGTTESQVSVASKQASTVDFTLPTGGGS